MSIYNSFPPLKIALELEPEELAIPVLNSLLHCQQVRNNQLLNLHNFVLAAGRSDYAADKKDELAFVLTEAWVWLEREGMIAPVPENRDWIFVTRRGIRLASDADIGKYIRSNLIPKESLDPVLANKVIPLFIRGDYDTAVFQAFKEVEVRVRKAASLPQELVGVDLMRKAFNLKDGPLTDKNRHKAESEAMSHLFAGTIDLFKNPPSHRDINWEDPGECAELIYLANHLIRVVKKHSRNTEDNK